MSEQIKNKLWSVVENSNVYSFQENPLPVFGSLAFKYWFTTLKKGPNEIENVEEAYNILLKHVQNSVKWEHLIFDLMSQSNKDLNDDAKEDLKVFEDILFNAVGDNIEILKDIVDFFAEKYITLHTNNCLATNMSKDLINFIYWCAAENADWVQGLALYNPYAGISPFGKIHLENIKSQIQMYMDDNQDEYIDDLRKLPWYSGVESDKTLWFISNLCLLVREPENFDQMFINLEDAVNDDISSFTGDWTYLAIPPLKSYTEPTESDVELVSSLVDKFIDAKGMFNGFFLLPKLFCYDESYEMVRSKIVCSGNLYAVIELPQQAFNFSCDVVLVILCKSTWECGTKMLNGNDYICDDELDYDKLREDCIQPHKSKIIGDYTFSQCNYCILPSMYLQSGSSQYDNEDLKNCYYKYLSFVESQAVSEKKRIAHRNVSAQLSHMLGATYHKIFDAILELKYIEGLEETYSMLYDNFDYMKRLINSIDDDFSSQKMNFEEVPVNEFLQKYCCAWKNYGKKQFSVDFTSEIDNNTTFKVDEVFMKVLLDAVLNNANRHGFNGVEIENPQILISTSYTIVNKIPCVLITLANNGAPFPEGFAIEQYIREGEFGGAKGNTGRGGFHVYQIAKRHQGYISISSDDEWNVKINVMIPIEYYDECEIEKILEYGEKYM